MSDRHAYYRVQLAGSKDGTATFAIVDVRSNAGTYRAVGSTNYFRAYPQLARASKAGENLAFRHAERLGVPKYNVHFERI
jgi:hypothetical protein